MQLVGVLLLAGTLRAGWARQAGGARALPGTEVSVEALADSARRLAEAEARRRAPLGPGESLDPNRAPEEELDRLPGVGPGTAAAIVRARDTLPFRGLEDLERVRGIGPSTLRRLSPHLRIAAAPRPVGPSSVPARGSSPKAPGPVNVNRASAAELERLPGVGPVLAARIVEFRSRRGAFRGPEDLLSVSGIGPATLERLRPLVRF